MPVIGLQHPAVFKNTQKRHFHPLPDLCDLKEPCPYGKHASHQQEEDQHIRPPYKSVQYPVDLFNGL